MLYTPDFKHLRQEVLKKTLFEYFSVCSVWEIAVHLAVACGVYGDVFLCCPFSHEVSWMRS